MVFLISSCSLPKLFFLSDHINDTRKWSSLVIMHFAKHRVFLLRLFEVCDILFNRPSSSPYIRSFGSRIYRCLNQKLK
ncbi:expressed protein [Echinococcus multilocularis]|uniref:Expressed protein n=1 Tax=Echinococcus multilocularis TaxID=6211 RepID=A0A087W2C3_ECHMU|nr:expressed protein [Echinococcus multilocularis]